MKKSTRIFAAILSLLIIISSVPAAVFAAETATIEIVFDTDTYADGERVTAKVYVDTTEANAVGYSIKYNTRNAIVDTDSCETSHEYSDADTYVDLNEGRLARSLYLKTSQTPQMTDGKVLIDTIVFEMRKDGNPEIEFAAVPGNADFNTDFVYAVVDGTYLDAEGKVTYTVKLSDVKEDAKKELSAYKNTDNHSAEQIEQIASEIEKGNIAIDNAKTEAEVKNALEDAKKALDAIKEIPLVGVTSGGEEITLSGYETKRSGVTAFAGSADAIENMLISSRKTIGGAVNGRTNAKITYTQNEDGSVTFDAEELRSNVLTAEQFAEFKKSNLKDDYVLSDDKNGVIVIQLNDKNNRNRPFAYLIIEVPPVEVNSVTLDRQTAQIEIGQTVTLSVTTDPENSPVVWKSDNEAIAKVLGGVVTGVKAGTATITATSADKTATCVVTVTEPPVLDTTADIYISVSHDDKFFLTDSGEVMALKPMSVPYFDLALYGLEQYYFVSESYDQGGEVGGDIGEATDYEGKVTILHSLIWATEIFYLGIDEEDAGEGYLFKNGYMNSDVFSPEGSAGSMYIRHLWNMDENFNYYYNYAYPLASEGWGSTADQILLHDGDVVTVGHFTSWNFHLDDLSVFNFIKSGDKIIRTSADNGAAVEFTVMLAAKGGNYTTTHIPMAGRAVYVCSVEDMTNNTATWEYIGETDENGNVVFYTEYYDLEPGEYILGTPGQLGSKYINEICSTPGAIYFTVTDEEHTHSYGDWTVTKEPTCSEYGIKTRYCDSCKAYETDKVEFAHKKETVPGKAATCTETGLTEGEKCAYCGEIYVAQEEIPMKPHTEEILPAKAATCTESGLTEGKKCTVCGTVTVAQEEVAKLDHTPVVAGKIEATCAKPGYTGDTKCSVCGNQISTGKVVDKLAHTEVVVEGKAATCTEAGLTEGKKCTVCGTVTVEQAEIAVLGHKEEVIPGKAATCTETGLTEGKKCTVCGTVTVEQEEIAALGHKEEIIPGKPATETETGLTEGKKCSVCGEIIVKQEEIPVLEKEYTLGDVNGDGKVNALDATQILRYANNKASVLSGVEKDTALFKAADVNNDGKINALDATQILRYANNKASVFDK